MRWIFNHESQPCILNKCRCV